MNFSIQNKGQGVVCIRVLAPEHLAASFLAFIELKSRENSPKIKEVLHNHHDDYFIKLQQKAFTLFDKYKHEGMDVKSALSATNYALKSAGYANVSYDTTKQILSKSGRLRQNSVKFQ
jgi:hypothetical protein